MNSATITKSIENTNYQINHWTDCFMTSAKNYGMINISRFRHQRVIETKYGLVNKNKLIHRVNRSIDTYISLNAFRDGIRRTDHLDQIRNIVVDLDFYKLEGYRNKTLDEVKPLVLDMLKQYSMDSVMPMPNLMTYGHGIQLIWTIDKGLPAILGWAVQLITKDFINKLRMFNADPQCIDLTRLVRAPQSINSRNGADIKCDILYNKAYSYADLKQYCTDLVHPKATKRDKFRGYTRAQLKTTTYRIHDLETLAKSRTTNVGKRNLLLFWYGFHQALGINNYQQFEVVAKGFRDKYLSGLGDREFYSTAKSAFDDAQTFNDYYELNNHVIKYQANDGIVKPMKTINLIHTFEINQDEQKSLKTLVDGDIKHQRRLQYLRDLRHAKGGLSRKEYNKQLKDKKIKRIQIIRGILKQLPNAKQKEIAFMARMPRTMVSKTIKLMGLEDYVDIEGLDVDKLLLLIKSYHQKGLLNMTNNRELDRDEDIISYFVINQILDLLGLREKVAKWKIKSQPDG